MQTVTPIRAPDERSRDLSEDKALASIERYIKNPPENSRVFTITPRIAAHLIEHYNKSNRHLRAKLTKFTAAMSDGRWMLTGDTLKFSDAHLLRDGQHRLRACVRSGTPFQTHIAFGVPDDSFKVMDQGSVRDGGDILQIAGYSNSKRLNHAIRWAHLIGEGRAKQRDSLDGETALALVRQQYPDLPDYLIPAAQIYDKTGHPIGIVAAILMFAHRLNPTAAKTFQAAWIKGDHKPTRLAADRVYLIKKVSSGRVHDVVRAALLVMAWNLHVQKKSGSLKGMDWDPEQDFPQMLSGK